MLCKHIAATLYGVGARLDTEPELFFRLRSVDQLDLISAAGRASLPTQGRGTRKRIADAALAEVFGIELDVTSPAPTLPRAAGRRPTAAPGRSARLPAPARIRRGAPGD